MPNNYIVLPPHTRITFMSTPVPIWLSSDAKSNPLAALYLSTSKLVESIKSQKKEHFAVEPLNATFDFKRLCKINKTRQVELTSCANLSDNYIVLSAHTRITFVSKPVHIWLSSDGKSNPLYYSTYKLVESIKSQKKELFALEPLNAPLELWLELKACARKTKPAKLSCANLLKLQQSVKPIIGVREVGMAQL